MNLGRAIKNSRSQKGLTQSELAAQADISVSYLSLLEQGKRTPNITVLENIGHALKIPVSVLMFIASDKEDISELSQEVIDKLAAVAFELMNEKK